MSRFRIVQSTVVALLISSPAMAAFMPPCEIVYESFPSCMEFLVGYSDKPTLRCCYGIGRLNFAVFVRMMSSSSICKCIEAMVIGAKPPLLATRITELNYNCHTQRSFPISASMDCSRVA